MLKDFLYLKEKNLKDVIELLLKAYTSSFSDSEQNLKKRSLGKAHHRLIVLIDNNPGIKVTEILNILLFPFHLFQLSFVKLNFF